jgi:hypothetical protein
MGASDIPIFKLLLPAAVDDIARHAIAKAAAGEEGPETPGKGLAVEAGKRAQASLCCLVRSIRI